MGNVFDRAAEVLKERGHCKRVLESRSGEVCLRGALNVVLNGRATRWCSRPSVEHAYLDQVAVELFPGRGSDSALVNNHPDTTFEDVQLILKHASYEWNLAHP